VRRYPAIAALALLVAGAAAAQEVRTAVVPDSVTTGDVFRVAVRVLLPRSAEASFPDSLPLPDDVEAAASRIITRDSVDAERDAVTAAWGLAAWRPGAYTLDAVEVKVTDGGRTDVLRAPFGPLRVVSVLPADTSGIEPQPPRGVIGPNRAWLPLIVLALLVAVVVAAGFRAWRRRPRPVAALPSTPPRERALAELDRIFRSGLLEEGRYIEFCSAVTGVVRTYLADLSPDWGTDLTTTELAFAMRADPAPLPPRIADAQEGEIGGDAADPAVALIRLLGAADVLKFTGVSGTAAGAERLWSRARDWVGANDGAFRRAA
jgi:hypothetical protein